MAKANVVELAPQEEVTEDKPKTDKKYLKRAEKIVRRLDNVLTDLHIVGQAAQELYEQTDVATSEVSDKDLSRIGELTGVIDSAANMLYYLTERMARKYVGKSVDSLETNKRKSLKA